MYVLINGKSERIEMIVGENTVMTEETGRQCYDVVLEAGPHRCGEEVCIFADEIETI